MTTMTKTPSSHHYTDVDARTPEHLDATLSWLHHMHALLSIIHALSAVVLVILIDRTLGSSGRVPIFLTYYVRPGARGQLDWSSDHTIIARESNIGYWIVLFLLLASLDHFLVAWPLRTVYERNYLQRVNHFRWAEYSISLPIMSAVIMILCGGIDLFHIALVCTLTSACIAFGWINEAFQKNDSGWLYLASWLYFALAWCAKFVILSRAPTVPSFVWPIIGVLLVLESLFGCVSSVRHRPYWQTEVFFGILSLLAKQLLAWMTYSGVANLPHY